MKCKFHSDQDRLLHGLFANSPVSRFRSHEANRLMGDISSLEPVGIKTLIAANRGWVQTNLALGTMQMPHHNT